MSLRFDGTCPVCLGDRNMKDWDSDCPACEGKGIMTMVHYRFAKEIAEFVEARIANEFPDDSY